MTEDKRQTTIGSVYLQKFRSYHEAVFEFEPGVNIIVGPNASGKTNLLEALLVVCSGSSFRAKDFEMVEFDAPWSRIDAQLGREKRVVKLKVVGEDTVNKEFELDGKKLSRLVRARTIPQVLFEPNHLRLLHGSPEARRDYLDNLLEQLRPGYGRTRRMYKRALAQRNALLKSGGQIKNQLFAWDIRLADLGMVIAKERSRLVGQINGKLNALYKQLADAQDKEVDLEYQSVCPVDTYSSTLIKALEDRRGRDIERGFTTLGPHREDMLATFNGKNVQETASRGETRTLLLALKILELSFIEEVRDVKPILLLDDVFSELDGKRRKALTEALAPYQTFITTTDADIILHHFTDNCRVIPL